jgi:ACT domain-containing protein
MTNELYNMLANPDKYGAVGLTWNCTSCLASTARVLEAVSKYENRIKEVENRVNVNENAVVDLGKKVETISEDIKKRDDKLERYRHQTKQEIEGTFRDS